MNIHDGGEYSCEVETDDAEPTAVVHTVEILGTFYLDLVWFQIQFQISFKTFDCTKITENSDKLVS